MIDPQHQCSWTGRRLTEIAVSETGLTGAGVSLRVLLHAFTGQELVWYARVSGDLEDNLLLVGVDRATAVSLERRPPPSLPSLSAAADPFGLELYALSDEVASRLGVRGEDNRCLVERRDGIRHTIDMHDDCFFLVEPLEDALRKKLVHAILRQHSFYLDLPVDWTDVLDPLDEILARAGTIRLRSDPGRQRLVVSWESPTPSFWARISQRRASREIRIDKGNAQFVDVSERTR
jgi:hypothetical protein